MYLKKEENVNEMSTQEIINQIVDNELYYKDLFSSQFIGLEKFKINNVFYKELKKRTDAVTVTNYLIENETNKKRYDNLLLLSNLLDERQNYHKKITMSSRSNIYAPNGTEVDYVEYKTNTLISQDDLYSLHTRISSVFPYLSHNLVIDANDAYNCHSFAWYKQEPNNYWIYYPTSYLDDDSYYEVTDNVRRGDILCYYSEGEHLIDGSTYYGLYISHSAIVVNNYGLDLSDADTLVNVDLISKFGAYGVYNHNGYYCFYSHCFDESFQYVKAFRPKTDIQYTFDEYTLPFNRSIVVNSSNKYEMYELNINFSRNYNINVSSNNVMDVRLYNKNMQIISENHNGNNFSINPLLSTDIYYLRVAFINTWDSGMISTSIVGHTHSPGSPYLWKSYTKHEATCACGTKIEEFHVISSSSQIGGQYATCMFCGGPAIGIIRNKRILAETLYKYSILYF